jgi:uncharacterized protein YutE (UPF0331/DUF86 family)
MPTCEISQSVNIEIAIQCCIDICHRIISLENTRKPADYYEAFLLVGELGIISPAYRHLQQLSDLEQFADKIRHWLQRKNS